MLNHLNLRKVKDQQEKQNCFQIIAFIGPETLCGHEEGWSKRLEELGKGVRLGRTVKPVQQEIENCLQDSQSSYPFDLLIMKVKHR